ncbi:acylphosphatase [uncultured Methylovirgula sp.]|uniref:acylphosphatase n=1 Tax=uncultured Methylovirgula sp. TaxID=1285960 RepID=UPI002601B11C|nr:acylphosphatase [uncultured Methylovirgula sp.]
MAEAEKIVIIWIEGHVQGVGFRAFIEREADRLSIRGWARNRQNGDVEALFAGSIQGVDALIETCRRGPHHARVVNLMVRLPEADELLEVPHGGFLLLPTI